MTIENYLNQYHTKQTADSYLRAINHFLFHSKHKEESGYADIVSYLFEYNYRSERIIAGIKRYFDYLVETGKRNDHPCKGFSIKKPRVDEIIENFVFPSEKSLIHFAGLIRFSNLIYN